MSRILLGTRNEGKIEEAKELLAEIVGLELLTFFDVAFSDVAETGVTFLDNAVLKARAICHETGLAVLSEDSGLEVVALGGAPGVRSARFAGEPSSAIRNNELLLERLSGERDRRARFMSVAVLYLPDEQVFATSGTLAGTIGRVLIGTGGFGYDPLFIPDAEARTLAQLTLEEKNTISHRQQALQRMSGILQSLMLCGELTNVLE